MTDAWLAWFADVFFRGFCTHGLLPLLALFVMLLLWGRGGRAFGVPYLFWHERFGKQLVVGFALGLLMSQLGFVGFLLDSRLRPVSGEQYVEVSDGLTAYADWRPDTRLLPVRPWIFGPPRALFPGSRITSALACYLVVVWAVLVGAWLLGAGLLFLRRWWTTQPGWHPAPLPARARPWGMAGGLLLAAAFTAAVLVLTQDLFRDDQGDGTGDLLPPAAGRLHLLAAVNAGLLVGSYLLLYLDRRGRWVSPAVSLGVLLAWAAAVYGFLEFYSSQAAVAPAFRWARQVPVLVAPAFWLVLLVTAAVVLNSFTKYKHTFPGLEDYYHDARLRHLREYPPPADGAPALLTADQVRWPCLPGKPRLAVVCVSGGGIRAAVWAARVLTELEKAYADFPRHVRLVTGASGGLVGAAYYVAALPAPGAAPRPPAALDDLVCDLGRDLLSPVAQHFLLFDLPAVFWPGRLGNDRGRVLEQALAEHTRGLLATPVRALAADEQAGWRPSLVFSPMLVEDGRRLLISNLDLDFLTHPEGDWMGRGDYRYSRTAVEFFKLFPAASGLRLGTAARMSATFPYVSPAVDLPTDPRRRVVDAGYYDNFGVDLAASWVYGQSRWLLEHTSGVVLVQVRDDWSESSRRELAREGERPSRWPGLQWLTTPLEGLLAAREAVMSFRNDEELEVLSCFFHREAGPGFFTTALFECPEEASLSWYLTADERRRLVESFEPPRDGDPLAPFKAQNRERLQALAAWLRGGG